MVRMCVSIWHVDLLYAAYLIFTELINFTALIFTEDRYRFNVTSAVVGIILIWEAHWLT